MSMSPRAPSDRFYSRLQWTLIALVAALLLYGFVIARFVPTPRGLGFRLFILSMLAFNALWWSVADRRFARFVESARLSKAARAIAGVFTAGLIAPLVYMFITGRVPQFMKGPVWYASAVTLWNIGLAFCLPVVAGLRLAALAGYWSWQRWSGRGRVESGPAQPSLGDKSSADNPAMPTAFVSRRALLKTAVASVPMAALGGSILAWRDQAAFVVRKHEVPAPWLPDRLRGLTISHVSDLHVGRLFRPDMLPRVVEAVNALNSDLLLITGDIVDNSNALLPPTLDAIGRMQHRYGCFLCIGNHDEIDDRAEFIHMVRERFDLLINRRRSLEIGGERLCIAGIDYAGSDEPRGGRPGHRRDVRSALMNYDKHVEGPMIALAHHPHTWDALRDSGVPLTLSGHTHGGQLMIAPPGSGFERGAGELLFRYIRGFFGDDRSRLFVNSGVGNWFPVRINAPAEIVQLRLT